MIARVLTLFFFFCIAIIGQGQSTIVMENPVVGKDYGAILNCHFDASQCSKKAIDKEVQVVLTAGEWTLNSTVALTYRDQLVLDFGASLVRDNCNNSDPILHLKGRYSAVIGKSKNLVKSKCNDMVNGIIKIGHTTASSKGNIISCKLQNILIQGPTNVAPSKNNGYSNHPFDEITAIHLYNNQNEPTQKNLTANYYHTLRDIDISFVSIGIHLYNSTACTIDNILLNRVGLHGGHGILIEGGLENKISNVHHGFSPNANSLSFIKSRYSYSPSFNHVTNYIVEIGKMSGDLAKVNGGGHCLNLDVEPNIFYDNEITMGCNHPTGPTVKKGKSIKDYQTQKNRSVIR